MSNLICSMKTCMKTAVKKYFVSLKYFPPDFTFWNRFYVLHVNDTHFIWLALHVI